ncbi:unnamed protein product, partial [Ectocarpus sp. 8 AP-2014]
AGRRVIFLLAFVRGKGRSDGHLAQGGELAVSLPGVRPKWVCRWQSLFSSSSNVGLLLQTLEVLLSWARKIDVSVRAREFSSSVCSPTVVFSDTHVSSFRLRGRLSL